MRWNNDKSKLQNIQLETTHRINYSVFSSFIHEYGQRNPNMIKQFRQAITLKSHQASLIRQMADYTKKYCSEEHVFEMMLDYRKYMECEKSIRHGLGKESFQKYSTYIATLSQSFQELVEDDWHSISEVIIDLKTFDIGMTTSVVAPIQEENPQNEVQ